MKKNHPTIQFLTYLFLLVGLANLMMMLDTMLSDQSSNFELLDQRRTKMEMSLFYALNAIFLIYLGIDQMMKIKLKNK